MLSSHLDNYLFKFCVPPRAYPFLTNLLVSEDVSRDSAHLVAGTAGSGSNTAST